MPLTQKISILVIEDNPDHHALIRRCLRRADGLNIENLEHRETLAKGLLAYEKRNHQVVLLDLELPDSSAQQTIQNAVPALRESSLIVLTSSSGLQEGAEATAMGAEDYIEKKDLTPEVLERHILFARERSISRQRALDQRQFLNRFSHALAHELRNPLQTVLTTLGLLEENADDLPEIYRGFLPEAHRQAQRMRDLIKGMLDFAEEPFDLVSEPIDLNELLAEILERFERELEVPFTYSLQQGMPQIIGAELPLQQVFENLITNAINYAHPERPLHIDICHSGSDGRLVELSVRDNGIGISALDQVRIFEPFFRVISAESREGSGLGLNFCRQIIEALRGRISVESDGHQGSTFHVFLPAAPVVDD